MFVMFQMMSPTHHKSPTVAGTPHLTEYESSPSFPPRPQSTILISHTAPMTIPEGKSAPVLPHHEATKLSSSPLKSSPEQFGLEAQVSGCMHVRVVYTVFVLEIRYKNNYAWSSPTFWR